jgi:hypothetical protein
MERIPEESRFVMADKTETLAEEIKRKSVPYHLMDPETKAEFEASAYSGDIWNEGT